MFRGLLRKLENCVFMPRGKGLVAWCSRLSLGRLSGNEGFFELGNIREETMGVSFWKCSSSLLAIELSSFGNSSFEFARL